MVPWGKGGSQTSRPRPKAPDFGFDSEGQTSEDSSDEELAVVQQGLDHSTDEMAWRLADNCKRLSDKIVKLRHRKQDLRTTLTHYQKKEIEFVSEMDSHMDGVERTEQQLNERIEALTSENEALRCGNDARAQENEKLAEELDESAKHCDESETRVHFLMDRLVALLSASCTDPSQMEKVTWMLERERDTLRQLKEARQQLDEVRQRNCDLGERLREEQGLSRRLRDQLHEAEKMLKNGDEEKVVKPLEEKPRRNGLESSGTAVAKLPVSVRPADYRPFGDVRPARNDQGEARFDGSLKVKKTFQETSDKLIKGPAERSPLGKLPPSISEADEPREVVAEDRSPPRLDNLGVLSSSEADSSMKLQKEGVTEVAGYWTMPPMPERHRPQASSQVQMTATAAASKPPDDSSKADAVRETVASRLSPPSSPNRPAPRTTPPKPTSAGSVAAPQKPATMPMQPALAGPNPSVSPHAVVLSMEQKLRDALDAASFGSPVVRIASGIYSFGPLRAKVQLNQEGEVVASREDGRVVPIAEFIRAVSLSSREQQAPAATSSAAHQASTIPSSQLADSLPAAVPGIQSHAPTTKATTQRAASSPPSTTVATSGQGQGLDLGVSVPLGSAQPQLRPFPGTVPGSIDRAGLQSPPKAAGHEQRRTPSQGPVYQTRDQASLVSSARTIKPQGPGSIPPGPGALHGCGPGTRAHSPGPPPAWRDATGRQFVQDHSSPAARGQILTTQGQSSTPPPERFRSGQPAQPTQSSQSPPPARQNITPQGMVGPPVSNPRLLLAASAGSAVTQGGAVRMGGTLSPGRRICPPVGFAM